jgi:hypothetical protein
MYSADPGEEAIDRLPSDGESETNSLYTRHLMPLLTSDQTLQAIAQHVRAEVRGAASKVKHSQTPAYYDGLVGLACLSASCAKAARTAGRN